VKKPVIMDITYNGSSIAKNTIFNLVGYGIPLIFALAIIPSLIKGLGTERFGILNLAWVIIGYFSFFDFGISRALTKVIAEKIGTNLTKEIPGLFWTSFYLMLFIGLFFTVVIIILAPALVHNIFNISKALQPETLDTFYILALSIPVVTTTAGIRGALEAYQKFGIINIIRIFLGVLSFLVPLLCLFFTNSLFWIALFLIVVRIIVWSLYLREFFKLKIKIINKLYFDLSLVKPILKLSGWMTVSNVIVPLIVYLDRFLIGALVSATAIAYYATPYEAVTKLLVIPGALTGVLFPAFSASYLNNPEFAKKLSMRAVKYTFIFMFPITLIIVTFAQQGMSLWLGEKFAENSTLILQLLAAGVLFNCIAYIPFSFLQGIGRPDITAKVNLIELPIYVAAMWVAITYNGINGAASVWMTRMAIDALILFYFAKKIVSANYEFKFNFSYLIISLLLITSALPVMMNDVSMKLLLVSLILFIFAIISWKYLLLEEEKTYFFSRIKIFNS